ncbi:shikimate transporter [Escherichia coli]|nr:shikimate transporter [Escherichia coli]
MTSLKTSIKTITYLSDIGCLEIQGASLSIMLANIAHDMVVCVQQPMFTEMFGASYRYSGAGVGYQVASVVGGGFTPFIAAALITYFAGNWHSVAIYLLAGCLISAMTALLMKDNQRA